MRKWNGYTKFEFSYIFPGDAATVVPFLDYIIYTWSNISWFIDFNFNIEPYYYS